MKPDQSSKDKTVREPGIISGLLEKIGRLLMMLWQSVLLTFSPPFRGGELLRQIDFIGVQSIPLIVFTGLFTGMVTALQTYSGVSRFGAQSLVSATVAVGLARELGPVLSALMIIGRSVSSMAAELGSMRNTQQIDALWSMAVHPVQYLFVPRIIAAILALPVLALFFEFFGTIGAYIISLNQLGIDHSTFISGIRDYMTIDDIAHGLIKSLAFGLVISLVGCTEGYYAPIGAQGVGSATTRSVVTSSVMVLAVDYVMTAFMFTPGS